MLLALHAPRFLFVPRNDWNGFCKAPCDIPHLLVHLLSLRLVLLAGVVCKSQDFIDNFIYTQMEAVLITAHDVYVDDNVKIGKPMRKRHLYSSARYNFPPGITQKVRPTPHWYHLGLRPRCVEGIVPNSSQYCQLSIILIRLLDPIVGGFEVFWASSRSDGF